MTLLSSLAGRTSDFAHSQPLLALCLGAALFAVFLSLWLHQSPPTEQKHSLAWTAYNQVSKFVFAVAVVLVIAQSLGVLRTYLRRTVSHFQQTHGRITEANYNAVQTIWGAEQTQRELSFQLYYEEEVVERTEFEDPSKPAIIRRKTVRRHVPGNPFLSAMHEVTLKQNARKKGSALYGGYETTCRFAWKLKNPSERSVQSTLRFPLPAEGAIYDELAATINSVDVLPKMQLSESALVLKRDLGTNEELSVAISFKSRGMSYWYFQVTEPREIRDFTMTLSLLDLPNGKLNYPEGCMSPTTINPTEDKRGSILTYRLDHAISQKGMGISVPTLPQPGETTNAVLGEAERGWTLVVAIVFLTLILSRIRHAALIGILFASASAVVYGLLGDFSDVLFGFWRTAVCVLVPFFVLLAWLSNRIVTGKRGKALAVLLLIFGLFYPAAAGLDQERQSLYLNVCGLLFLGFAASQLMLESKADATAAETVSEPATNAV